MAAAASGEPEAFLNALLGIVDDTERFRRARVAVGSIRGGRTVQWDFMLRCVELISAEPEWAPRATLATLVSRVRPTPRDHAHRTSAGEEEEEEEEVFARQRALCAAVQLWRVGQAVATATPAELLDAASRTRALRNAVRVASSWGATQEDALATQQLGDVSDMISHLIEHESWDYVIDILPLFPMLGDRHLGSLPERVAASCGLMGSMPNAEGRGASKVRSRLASGKPMRAIATCGRSDRLRRLCLELLLEEGMFELAQEQADLWWLPLNADGEALSRQETRRCRHLCLPWRLPLVWVDREEQLAEEFGRLRRAQVVGFDVELTHRGVPALLQLAVPGRAVLVDLLALGSCVALGAALAALFADVKTIKLGFGGTQDFKFLKRLPAMKPFAKQPLEEYVDVQRLAAERRATQKGSAARTARHGLGLAALSDAVLGRPLDKAMQASNWARRPLSRQQAHYAALDAWVLLELHARLRGWPAPAARPALRLLRGAQALLRRAWFGLRTRRLPMLVAKTTWLRGAS